MTFPSVASARCSLPTPLPPGLDGGLRGAVGVFLGGGNGALFAPPPADRPPARTLPRRARDRGRPVRQPAPAAEHDPARRHAHEPAAVPAGAALPARLFVLALARRRARRDGPALVPFWPAALGLFVLVVVVCDLLPKMFALRQPERVARPARRGAPLPAARAQPGVRRPAGRRANGSPTGSRPPQVRTPAQDDGSRVRRAGGGGRGGRRAQVPPRAR